MTHDGVDLSRENPLVLNTDELMWGAGDSPVRSRGAGRRSDQFRWEDGHAPESSSTGYDHSVRFSEDFSLFFQHGLRHLHVTIDWSRIEPFSGRLDHEELEFTHHYLQTAREAGLSPWLTLHNGALPGWFAEDTEGFRTTSGPSIHWSRHVDRMAELFDDYAAAWIPVSDPIRWAIDGHALGQRPPGRRSMTDSQDAIEGIIDATFDAHRLLSSGSTPIVGSFGLPQVHANDEHPSTASTDAQAMWDQVIWRSWSRAITDGVLEWPWQAAVERPDMADAFSAIAVAVSSPLGVDSDATLTTWPPGQHRRDATGRTPSPERLGDILHRASELLPGKDLLVTRLGVDDDDDQWRSSIFESSLDQIFTARNDGLPVRGIFLEPTIDGYSEAAGRFVDGGVFTRDREPKPSFQWIEAQM